MKNANKKKIVFIIPSLAGGGAEKVLVDLLRHLDRDKYDMHLVLFEKAGVHLNSIPSYIEIYDLKKRNRYDFFKIIARLASLFKDIKPDAVLSFMAYTNTVTILAKMLSWLDFTLNISVHNSLFENLSSTRLRKIKTVLFSMLFNHAKFIVVPSQGIKLHLIERFNAKEKLVKVINNPLDINTIKKMSSKNTYKTLSGKHILAIGRLTKQKNFPLLLKTYALISKDIEEKLVILGEGGDKDKLKELAKDLGIQEKVLFLGFQNNPYKFMKNASIFVLSSSWESFAIVLVEAMACGTPVISTDCPSGPGEIIISGKNGLLVPPGDEKALANAMATLLRDENLRNKFSEEGRKRAEDFKIEKILPQYEKLFQEKN